MARYVRMRHVPARHPAILGMGRLLVRRQVRRRHFAPAAQKPTEDETAHAHAPDGEAQPQGRQVSCGKLYFILFFLIIQMCDLEEDAG